MARGVFVGTSRVQLLLRGSEGSHSSDEALDALMTFKGDVNTKAGGEKAVLSWSTAPSRTRLSQAALSVVSAGERSQAAGMAPAWERAVTGSLTPCDCLRLSLPAPSAFPGTSGKQISVAFSVYSPQLQRASCGMREGYFLTAR